MLRQWEFYRVFFANDPESLAELKSRCSDTPQPDEERILGYLGADLDISGVGCTGWDRLGARHLNLGLSFRSDGVWVWPNLLEYYVREYHLRIPDEFVRHMAARNWRPPQPDELDFESICDQWHGIDS
jgi:hypothetical protein